MHKRFGHWLRRIWNRGKEPVSVNIESTESIYPETKTVSSEDIVQEDDLVLTFRPDFPLLYVARSAFECAVTHTENTLEVEAGGICLGHVYFDKVDGRLLLRLEKVIEAINTGLDEVVQTPASLTFTAETWRQLIEKYQSRAPDLRLIGWYHSHPGFGVFLSGMDLGIHNQFFVQPWQLAVVIDPVQRHFCAFVRNLSNKLAFGLVTYSVDKQTVQHIYNGFGSAMSLQTKKGERKCRESPLTPILSAGSWQSKPNV